MSDPLPKILVVDDSATVVTELISFLSGIGAEVIAAANGQEGLEMFKSHPDIALCISDINMPIMDGLTMMEHVRKEVPAYQNPVLMLTTEFNREARQRGKELGVKGWIVKPFSGERSLGAIKKLLET